jgi:glycosyltransferase involved in cell wall biosynthesis
MSSTLTATKEQPQISVVIPTYNYGRFLSRAIDSVLAQTVTPLEIWVADDGSTDQTANIVAQYGDAVRYQRFDHCGVYAVRQAMLDRMRGDWFLNLDADNWIEPDFLEKAMVRIQALGKESRIAFLYPDIQRFGQMEGRLQAPAFDLTLLKKKNFLDMNSLIRTEVARRFGFDPAFNAGQGDYDFFLTLAKNGWIGEHLPDSPLHYRTHGRSITQISFRRFRQREITRRLLAKHRSFFTREEAVAARATAANRTLVALTQCRSPFAGVGRRLHEWGLFVRSGWRHAGLVDQTRYALTPRRYFLDQSDPTDLFMLFRDTPDRREMIQRVQEGGPSGLNGGQLFGLEEMMRWGQSVDCNLRLPRVDSWLQTLEYRMDQRQAPQTGIGRGDQASLRVHLDLMNRAGAVLATGDNTGVPAVRLKASGKLRVPLVYVSIGLPERMQAVTERDPERARQMREQFLKAVDRFVVYGAAEAEWLRQWLGESDRVQLIPFGVDTEKWKPAVPETKGGVDVLSIGADSQRDFELLVEYARQHPDCRVGLITSSNQASKIQDRPANLQLWIQLPVEEVRNQIASARMVVLPVKENTYSGATTTLLQCMAMGKAVAVSRVGAIREGYGFEDGHHLRWMEPGSQDSFSAAVDELLSDAEICRRLGEAGRQHVVKQLGWERFVKQLVSCMDDCRTNRKSPI